MPNDEWIGRELRLGCEAADAAMADLQRIDDPTLWMGPAATMFRTDLADHLRVVRPAVGAARTAAGQHDAAAATEAG